MRIILFLLLGMPLLSASQINRSANGFARERIEDYLGKNIFRNETYKISSFGELKSQPEDRSGVVWTIDCDCRRTRKRGDGRSDEKEEQVCRFVFYLDKKLKVVQASSYESR